MNEYCIFKNKEAWNVRLENRMVYSGHKWGSEETEQAGKEMLPTVS